MSQGTFTRRIVTEYRTPEEALRLAEDVRDLNEALRLVRRVDHYNCAEDPEIGRKVLRYVQGKLKMAEGYARRKLAVEFLDPRKKRMNETKARRSN